MEMLDLTEFTDKRGALRFCKLPSFFEKLERQAGKELSESEIFDAVTQLERYSEPTNSTLSTVTNITRFYFTQYVRKRYSERRAAAVTQYTARGAVNGTTIQDAQNKLQNFLESYYEISSTAAESILFFYSNINATNRGQNTAIFFVGDEKGAGKSFLSELISEHIATRFYYASEDIGAGSNLRFNAQMEGGKFGSVICRIDEARNFIYERKDYEQLKTFITSNTLRIERKGVDASTQQNNTLFILCANVTAAAVFRASISERRFLPITIKGRKESASSIEKFKSDFFELLDNAAAAAFYNIDSTARGAFVEKIKDIAKKDTESEAAAYIVDHHSLMESYIGCRRRIDTLATILSKNTATTFAIPSQAFAIILKKATNKQGDQQVVFSSAVVEQVNKISMQILEEAVNGR